MWSCAQSFTLRLSTLKIIWNFLLKFDSILKRNLYFNSSQNMNVTKKINGFLRNSMDGIMKTRFIIVPPWAMPSCAFASTQTSYLNFMCQYIHLYNRMNNISFLLVMWNKLCISYLLSSYNVVVTQKMFSLSLF